jgi:hypothetical protein
LAYDQKPLIVMINNRNRFLQTTDHPLTIAYAIPKRNLIVIDYSRVVTTPFSLETTLTHEFCHLLLHEHIPNIPRWLDEGLCQWASGGVDEIIYNLRQSQLNQRQSLVILFLLKVWIQNFQDQIRPAFLHMSKAKVLLFISCAILERINFSNLLGGDPWRGC